MNMFDDEPGGGRLNPADCLDHLLMVWAIDYIEHSPTKFSVPGKNSDVVVVDVVDLDQADEDGYQGLIVRNCWWRNARLIGLMKPRIARPKPVLGRMGLGVATMGKPPYEIHFATDDSDAVGRASAWIAAHPDFRPTARSGRNYEAERVVAEQPTQRQPSQLEQMAARVLQPTDNVFNGVDRTQHQAVLKTARNGNPPPPPPPMPANFTEEPPF